MVTATATPRKSTKKAPAKKATKATTTPRKRTGKMTAEHKTALALGREESNAVRQYLDALDAHKPKRGRQVTPGDLRARIEKNQLEAANAKASERLLLVQERLNLETRLEATESAFDITSLQAGFVRVGKAYAERKGISYYAFREVGVPPAVLQEAGIARSMK